MQIDVQTKMITLIGNPLKQSFASRMQNTGYQAAGLNYVYFYTETGTEHLGEIINGIRYMPSFGGCAITKPNKVAVMQYLDEVDPLCEKMGACNTVLRKEDGTLKGYNTDGLGFQLAIEREAGIVISDMICFCIGAGGAGRAIASILAYSGVKKVFISDICEESAQKLVYDINREFCHVAEYVPYGVYEAVKQCNMLVNASGIGMGHTIGQSPLPKEYFQADQFCFDACYNPDQTQFLLDAAAAGCKTMNGLDMSLYQGAAQIELWTGKPAPISEMRAELKQILKEQNV